MASYVTVRLFGGGPGLNFDFARLSFHVPMMGSVCAKPDSGDKTTRHTARKATTLPTSIKVLRILITPPYKMLFALNQTRFTGRPLLVFPALLLAASCCYASQRLGCSVDRKSGV